MIKFGVKFYDIVEFVERRIVELGGKFVFLCNFLINEIVVYYIFYKGDGMVLKEGDYLKFDIGVYVDGYIVDIVVIFRVGMEEDEFMEVVREVFENVIVMVRVGVMIRDVVRVIEEIIWGKGFNLIVNLSGYKVECYKFYVGVSVFNVYREVDIYVF